MNTIYQNLHKAAKPGLTEKCIALKGYIRKEERSLEKKRKAS